MYDNRSYTRFGIEAKKILLDKGMTQTDLAKELQISNSYLTEIFKGTRKGTKQKERISKILGMELQV